MDKSNINKNKNICYKIYKLLADNFTTELLNPVKKNIQNKENNSNKKSLFFISIIKMVFNMEHEILWWQGHVKKSTTNWTNLLLMLHLQMLYHFIGWRHEHSHILITNWAWDSIQDILFLSKNKMSFRIAADWRNNENKKEIFAFH